MTEQLSSNRINQMDESSKSVAWAFVENRRNIDAINILCNQVNMNLPEACAQVRSWQKEIGDKKSLESKNLGSKNAGGAISREGITGSNRTVE